MLNPLRSEDEAFRFLLYAIAVIVVIAGLIAILRALAVRPAAHAGRRAYLTVSVPYIPAARWPGAWQKKV